MDIRLPKLADTLVEGTVARWLKQPGDSVRKGEPLVEIETDKVTTELEAPAEGVLSEILVAAGETVEVGATLARLGETGEPVEAPAGVHHAVTGPAAGALPPMRRRIAERMQEARARIPQGACVREVQVPGGRPAGRSWTAYFVKALAIAAGVENVGVAVEVPEGLVVPVVRGAGAKTVDELSAEIADLAERARKGRLEAGDVGGAGFTVTNVGGGGTLMAFPLVSPGEPGILAPGAIRDGRCYVTLCYDRRRYDDWAADRLLAAIAGELDRL